MFFSYSNQSDLLIFCDTSKEEGVIKIMALPSSTKLKRSLEVLEEIKSDSSLKAGLSYTYNFDTNCNAKVLELKVELVSGYNVKRLASAISNFLSGNNLTSRIIEE